MTEDTGTAGRGSAVARKALAKLLERAENATSRAQTGAATGGRSISLRLSSETFPDYLKLGRHVDKVECNAGLQLAERGGAIAIEWDVRAGDRAQVERIVLGDGDRLARHLGVEPRWVAVAEAERQFDPHVGAYPVLTQVVDSWRKGTAARGTQVGHVAPWLDGIRVRQLCAAKSGDDIPIRRLSASLFRDSKHVGSLWPVLDVLSRGELGAVPSAMEDVFAELGLVKFPPTLLIAGNLTVSYGGDRLRAARPYIGLAPRAFEGVEVGPAAPQFLLSVENLTTFHELAGCRPDGAIVIYTGGMPSPSWKRVYGRFLGGLPDQAGIFHWGDIDVGGFRIASQIAKCCEEQGRVLQLHSMNAAACPADAFAGRELSPPERAEIARICTRWGWRDEIQGLGLHPVEQEALALSWPERPGTVTR